MSRKIWWTLHGRLPNASKKFLLPGVLHNIVIKHGLSLAEREDDNKSNRDEELFESEEEHLQMSNWNYY